MVSATRSRHEEYLDDVSMRLVFKGIITNAIERTVNELNSLGYNTFHLLCNVPDKSSVRVWMHSFLELVVHTIDLK